MYLLYPRLSHLKVLGFINSSKLAANRPVVGATGTATAALGSAPMKGIGGEGSVKSSGGGSSGGSSVKWIQPSGVCVCVCVCVCAFYPPMLVPLYLPDLCGCYTLLSSRTQKARRGC